jgi:hypothetical protein
MRVIIAGSRSVVSFPIVESACLRSGFAITEVVSGGASGVDTLGERFARERGIPVRRFPADWSRFGRSAGPRRNREMAEYGEALVLVWDGQSRGSASMLAYARERRLPCFVVVVR